MISNKLTDKLSKLALLAIKPILKRAVVLTIKDNQVLVIKTMKSKVDIPKMTPEEEAVLFTRLYDAFEEAATLIIERI